MNKVSLILFWTSHVLSHYEPAMIFSLQTSCGKIEAQQLYMYIFTQPLHFGQDMTLGQLLSRVKLVWI